MTILPIVIAPDARLKEISKPVDKITYEIKQLVQNMFDTMYDAAGIGLAAIQVGVPLRILVMDIEQPTERYPDKEDNSKDNTQESRPLLFINPELSDFSEEENSYQEGCLSFPGQYADVVRPKLCKVSYLDLNGKKQVMACDELYATCIQHEMDHLNGVVFVDHVSKLKRKRIMDKLEKLKKKQAKSD